MPLKWKIFFALNFVLSLPALVCFILLFINLIDSYNRGSDYLFAFLFLFALLAITLNGFLNIYILQRFFPDKLIPPGIKTLNTTSLVLNALASAGLLILCIWAASLEFGSRYYISDGTVDASGKIVLAIMFFLWVVQVAVLIMQGQLPDRITRNNKESINSMIDSIGQ